MYILDTIQEKYCPGIIEVSKELFNSHESYEKIEDLSGYINNGFVILYQEKVVGFVTCAIVWEFDEPHFVIMSLGVSKEHQNKKLGKVLLNEVKKFYQHIYPTIKQNPEIQEIQPIIYLHVRTKNIPAIRLYQREGFQSIGILENFYQLPKDDAIHMIYKINLF